MPELVLHGIRLLVYQLIGKVLNRWNGEHCRPLLCQVVRLRSPANSRFVILTETLSLEASTREETALSMKLLLVVHGRESTASVEVREEDLRTGEAGASVTRTVDTPG